MDKQPLALHIDLEKYLGQLEDWDITRSQKEELIQTLWNVLLSFAEIGFEIHPVQRVLSKKPDNLSGKTDPDLLHSNYSVNTHSKGGST